MAANLTPDKCIADFDMRILPQQDIDLVLGDIRAIAGAEIEIAVVDWKPPVVTPTDHAFVRLCAKASRAHTNVSAEPLGVAYYSDAAILAPAFNLTMVIIGPGDLGISGSKNEFVKLSNVGQATKIYSDIALSYLQ